MTKSLSITSKVDIYFSLLFIIKMSIKKINRYLRTILNKFDLFPTNQFIKYNKKS